MTKLLLFIVGLIGSVVGLRTGFFQPAIDWLKEFVMTDIPDFIWPLLPDGLASYFRDFDVAAIAAMMSDVAWFIPFWQVLVIYFVAFAFAGAILLGRYIIGWIPTIEG